MCKFNSKTQTLPKQTHGWVYQNEAQMGIGEKEIVRITIMLCVIKTCASRPNLDLSGYNTSIPESQTTYWRGMEMN